MGGCFAALFSKKNSKLNQRFPIKKAGDFESIKPTFSGPSTQDRPKKAAKSRLRDV
jgi:hypothetical protein